MVVIPFIAEVTEAQRGAHTCTGSLGYHAVEHASQTTRSGSFAPHLHDVSLATSYDTLSVSHPKPQCDPRSPSLNGSRRRIPLSPSPFFRLRPLLPAAGSPLQAPPSLFPPAPGSAIPHRRSSLHLHGSAHPDQSASTSPSSQPADPSEGHPRPLPALPGDPKPSSALP